MNNKIKCLLVIIIFVNLKCSDINSSSEPHEYLQSGSYILKQSAGTILMHKELSVNSNIFNFLYKRSDGNTDLEILNIAGTISHEQFVLYLQIEQGYYKLPMNDSICINIPIIPETKAVLADFFNDTLKIYSGAIVFRRDSCENKSLWGKWKSNYTLGSGIIAFPVGKISKNCDSLTYLRLTNDSTWSFQSFDALSQTVVRTGKINKILEIKEAIPGELKDSTIVYDSKNDRLLAFWGLEQIPDIMIKTE